MVYSIKLTDGTSAPWLAYGNGTSTAQDVFTKIGHLALEAGFKHIDTAQGYGAEQQEAHTGALLKEYGAKDIYLTSKLSRHNGWKDPVPIDEIKQSIKDSVSKLQRSPDLFLIHNPYVPGTGNAGSDIEACWKIFEELKDEGVLKSIGVSNFRPQDLKTILAICKYKPVVNQLEFHPYVYTHLEPVLELQKEHGIITASYGPLTPFLHRKESRLTPLLTKIAARISKDAGKTVDETAVLLLWVKAYGAIAITTSSKEERIKNLAAVDTLPELTPEEFKEITALGKQVHYRFYTEHMEADYPLPDLPDK